MPQTTPQDRKPKAEAGHRFTVKGKSYTLPPISETAAESVPGEITFNAVLDPSDRTAQARLALAMLVATDTPAPTMAALKSLPTKEMFEVIEAWMGESSGSSE